MNLGLASMHASSVAGGLACPVSATSRPSTEYNPPLSGGSDCPLETLGYSVVQNAMTSLSAFWTTWSKQTASSVVVWMSGQVPVARPCTGRCALAAGGSVGPELG